MDRRPSPESFPAHQLQEIPLGSKRQSLLRQSGVLLSLAGVAGLVYWFYLELVGDPFSAFCLVALAAFCIAIHRGIRGYPFAGLPEFIAKDSAYGVITCDGIRYRAPFRLRRVSWANVYRLVYCLEDQGRIEMHLFNRHSPIRFGPSLSEYLNQSELLRSIEIRLRAAGVPLDLKEQSQKSTQPFYEWLEWPAAARKIKSFKPRNAREN